MAAFVSLATCHHCSVSSRHGLIYRDSMAALSRNVMVPSYSRRHCSLVRRMPMRYRGTLISQRTAGEVKPRPGAPRTNPPDLITVSTSKSASMKHFVNVQLRKLFSLSDTQRPRKNSLKIIS
ncbi:hypothetical protein DPEC_G00141170 [Dallia pectoralis]|uniref:Uncharacterized protein n=1 Tax=Dallia pectoralis TaxID=75939 RepID=A0ACC2GMQ5_DALPE|nr:hypothetical protein DPEC_G00141170 [Dallia pectoralis]